MLGETEGVDGVMFVMEGVMELTVNTTVLTCPSKTA